jgi:putative ABC transport system permease protein
LGALASALGILFISPLAIRAVAALSNRAPVTVRLALRDLARHQARSAAALAAISLALGIAAAIIISAAADRTAATAGNLPGTQMLVWIGQPDGGNGQGGPVVPVRTAAQLTAMTAAVHQITAPLPHSAVLPLEMAAIPGQPQPGGSGQLGQPVADLAVSQGPGRSGTYSSVHLYVATPAVLRYLGISPATIAAAIDIVTTQAGPLMLSTSRTIASAAHVRRIRASGYTSQPDSLITLSGLRQQHMTQIRSGWLITSAQPLTAAQVTAARSVAARAGLSIESRNAQASLGTISAAATAAGALLALGVLAMAVALIRTEAANDLRTLTATGATSTDRRTLTATTAGALALLSALIGTGSAYLALAAGHRSDLGVPGHVPVLDLAVIVLGVPAAAALAGWILTRRPQSSLGHRVLE